MSQFSLMCTRACRWLFASASLTFVLINTAYGQITAFTYQGKLTDNGAPTNSSYDLQFKLFDSADFVTGTQVGSTITKFALAVSNGTFSVELDFGAGPFTGAARFLEISVRAAGSANPFTVLGPRQPITATPYSVRSVSAAASDTATNAAQLAGIAANQYVVTTDARLSDARTPLAGSANYVQNTTNPQSTTNFNISGNGTAGGTLSGNIVNAATQYRLAGMRMLVVNGPAADPTFPLTASNTFLGENAGLNTTFDPAPNVINGKLNSFFGANAGRSNTFYGSANSFFGTRAGEANTDGYSNAFFGTFAGRANTIAGGNSFFGSTAGMSNTTGGDNSFFGATAGFNNTTGSYNTLLGRSAEVGAGDLQNATAIGYRARVDQSNSLVLGGINGVNSGSDTNVGIGTTAPGARLHVVASGGSVLLGNPSCGGLGSIGFNTFSGCTNYALMGGDGNTYINRPAGGTVIFREANGTNQVEIRPGGTIGIGVLDGGGSTSLCRNGAAAIATCSSSLRYKTDILPFTGGFDVIQQLRPIAFTWIDGGLRDVGFGAEEVEKVEPLLVTYNDKGEVEGVKYDRITVALVNTAHEQQAQIKQQQRQLELQQAQIDMLKQLVCADHRDASICRAN